MKGARLGGCGLAYLALELDLLVVAVRRVPLGKPGLAPETPRWSATLVFRASRRRLQEEQGGATHWRFCMSMKDSILGGFGRSSRWLLRR